jgi:aryl-alcohol dehydrogenase-like predicted oxidoreductase
MSTHRLARRDFLRAAGAAASAAILAACTAPTPMSTATPAPAATATSVVPTVTPAEVVTVTWEGEPVPQRPLGKTGQMLSVVGFGGIVVMDETIVSAKQLVAQAIARGINYFDVAPSYGNAESRLGPALAPYRESVFLACKTEQRLKEAAASSLQSSLELLQTDHFDLFQFHGVKNMAEVEAITGKGGALEAFLEARDKGQIKHIGFSAHSEEAALAMLDRFQFDTILYPINWACWYAGNFGPQVLQKAADMGLGILALKSLARGQWQAGETHKWYKCWYAPVDDPELVSLSLRFTLGKPVTAAVSPSHAELLWLACDAAGQLEPLSADEEAELVAMSKDVEPVFKAL